MAVASANPGLGRRAGNDERIRDAALAEALALGPDRLGPTAVARRAGLSTGAVYARYEDHAELLVDLWVNRCRVEVGDLVELGLDYLLGGGDDEDRDELLHRLANPSAGCRVGLDLLTLTHREDALAEVVGVDTARAFERWRLGSDHDPAGTAATALVLSILLGLMTLDAHGPRCTVVPPVGRPPGPVGDQSSAGAASLVPEHLASATDAEAAGGGAIDWCSALGWLRAALARPPEIVELPSFVRPLLPEVAGLDTDQTRAMLMQSCMEVIARVGLARATATRIGRRAGMTHGAIYGLYESKEELLCDSVRVITDAVMRSDRAHLSATYFDGVDWGEAVTGLLATMGGEERRSWRLFRMESHLAARHHPEVARSLDWVYGRIFAMDTVVASASGLIDPAVARAATRIALAIPLGYVHLAVVAPDPLASVDWSLAPSLLG